jgi:hypothetical protein
MDDYRMYLEEKFSSLAKDINHNRELFDERFNILDTKIDDKFDILDTKIDDRFNTLDKKMNDGFDRIEEQNKNEDIKVEKLKTELTDIIWFNKHPKIFLGIIIVIVLGSLGITTGDIFTRKRKIESAVIHKLESSIIQQVSDSTYIVNIPKK